jgi:hypothetical protein
MARSVNHYRESDYRDQDKSIELSGPVLGDPEKLGGPYAAEPVSRRRRGKRLSSAAFSLMDSTSED